MSSLSEIRTLGGVGSILVLIGSLTNTVGGLVAIIGFIMILVSTKRIADMTDDSIFHNMLVSVVLSIIGLVILLVTVISTVYSFLGLSGAALSTSSPPLDFGSFFVSILPGLIISWIFFLGSSIFLKRSYDRVATRVRVDSFKTAGLAYLIGALTSIVLIGLVIVLVAEIYQIMAFFSIPEKLSSGYESSPTRGTPLISDAFQGDGTR